MRYRMGSLCAAWARLAVALATLTCSPEAHRREPLGRAQAPVRYGAEALADPPILVPTRLRAGATNAAFDGTNFLVVWTEGQDLFGTRVAPDGSVLDPVGFRIATGVDDAV